MEQPQNQPRQGAVALDTVEEAIRRVINEHGSDPDELHVQEKRPGIYVVTATFAGERPDEHGTFTREGLRL